MSLLNEIKSNVTKPGGTCSVGKLLTELPKADQADLAAALADVTISAAAISKALIARGHTVRQDSVSRHRRRVCACDK